jgi:hypothetical protein
MFNIYRKMENLPHVEKEKIYTLVIESQDQMDEINKIMSYKVISMMSIPKKTKAVKLKQVPKK